jgi:serine/threonine protein kinase
MIGRSVKGRKGNKYTIVREIGHGGFGVVYLAEDDAKQAFALKMITPVIDPAIRLSFEQEIQSTLGLTHENLLSIVDFGECVVGGANGLFAVSEYCADGDYRRVLAASQPNALTTEQAVSDLRQILNGLSVLHSRIIHRDPKPENILISGGKLKVGDYGLAKFVDEATRTLTFKGAGTLRYMAPEVWLNQRATTATDLYAVGVMFFEALTGRPPFSAVNINTLRDMHLYTPAPRVKAINSAVPDSLDGIIKKLLSKDPSARYQAASEVITALEILPQAPKKELAGLAERMRKHHDAEEAKRLEQEQAARLAQDTVSRNRYKEEELLSLIDEVVAEINAHLAETKIQKLNSPGDREYRFGNRTPIVHFFGSGELYRDPEVPGRMESLMKHHAIHGGYIEIREDGQDREGWNLVLVRPPDSYTENGGS